MEIRRPDRYSPVLLTLIGMWFVIWSASVVQDIIIWSTGTESKVWLLDVNVEHSFYTWFSVLLLALGGLLSLLLGTYRDPAGRDWRWHWRALGFIFLFLSMDEMLSFHEKLEGVLSGAFTFAWVVSALLFVSVLGATYLKFLLSIPRRVGATMIIAGLTFVSGAVGVDMIGGILVTQLVTQGGSLEEAVATHAYRALTNIEEGLEGLGALIFIRALLLQFPIYFPHFLAQQPLKVNVPAYDAEQLHIHSLRAAAHVSKRH